MKIRNTSIKDLPHLTILFESYRAWYGQKADLPGATEFLEERLKSKDSEIFVCEKNDELVGFVQLYPLFSSTRMKKLWLLNDLFVSQNHRGLGISLLLIERSKQLVQDTGACAMFLETQKSNLIGNTLYPRAGFKINDESNYYEWTLK